MNFKKWFTERFDFPPNNGDIARRPDLIKGGESGCEDVPMGMKPMCQPTTSAFPTYSLPKKKKSAKADFKV